MQRNYMTITYAYHFIAEAVIMLFLSIPIFHLYYDAIPYVSYTFIVLASTFIYITFLHRITSYIPYLIIAPILAAVFYVLAYPWGISILFAVLLTRSAITLRNERKLENEGTYLRIILAVSILILIFIHDISFIIYVVSTLLLLIVGNILRNMTVLTKEDKWSKSTWFLTSMLGVIIAAITAVYFSFHSVRAIISFVWGVVTTVIVQIGGLLAYLFSLLIPILEPQENEVELGGMEEELQAPENYGELNISIIKNIFTWIFVILCIIAAFFIIRFIIRLMKKNFKQAPFDEAYITYEEIGSADKKKKSWKDRFRGIIPLSKNHVRKRMYQFERKMSDTDHARQQDETIEEWVNRAGWNIDFELYQRVRYGTHEGTKEDAEKLKEMLNRIEKLEEKRGLSKSDE